MGHRVRSAQATGSAPALRVSILSASSGKERSNAFVVAFLVSRIER
jgi:hypothetical protein